MAKQLRDTEFGDDLAKNIWCLLSDDFTPDQILDTVAGIGDIFTKVITFFTHNLSPVDREKYLDEVFGLLRTQTLENSQSFQDFIKKSCMN